MESITKTVALCLTLVLSASPAFPQQPSSTTSGQSPAAATPAQQASPKQQPPKPSRVFGIMPNYITVEGATTGTPPLTTKQKFKVTAEGAFDPYEFAVVGLLAGINQAGKVDNELGQGASGYGKRYAIGFADQVSGNFLVGAVVPSLLREDPRYFQLNRGSFLRRFGYAASRVLVIRTDRGRNSFNFSEVFGNAAAGALSNIYSPRQDRGLANTSITWGEQISIDALNFELKEFWPDVRRRLKRKSNLLSGRPLPKRMNFRPRQILYIHTGNTVENREMIIQMRRALDSALSDRVTLCIHCLELTSRPSGAEYCESFRRLSASLSALVASLPRQELAC